MRLKNLSLSLLCLSLAACSSHLVKNNNNANADIAQRAVQGFNALYEYSGFDYRGEVKIKLDQTQAEQTKSSDAKSEKLDPVLEQKVEQYLKQQNIKLSATEKKELYQTLVQQKPAYMRDFVNKGANVVQNILNDMQIKYDGSVNYRQKMASFNLETKYKKPNLLVEMRIPTVLDLQEFKFYTQIFSLMPYLANAQDQDKYAYYDFSKYKNEFTKVNTKALVEFLKQSGATSYVLASPNQIENISLTTAEKQSGVQEKIRLHTTTDEMLLQAMLYSSINRQYFLTSVLGQSPADLAKLMSDVASIDKDETSKDASDDQSEESANKAMYALYDAVNEQVYSHRNAAEDDAVRAAEDATASADDDEYNQASDEAERSDEQATDAEAVSATAVLTEQQCEDFAKTKSKARFGDVEYCLNQYDIAVLSNDVQKQSKDRSYRNAAFELSKKFEALGNKDQLVSAAQFKQLWEQHKTEVEASLPVPAQRTPMIVDLALDAQGRVAQVDYDVGMDFSEFKRKLNIKMGMQFLNYGNVSKIDRQVLNNAKSFKEIFKGSFMEQAVGGFSGASAEDSSRASYVSLDERLDKLATQVFKQTGSYEKTYKAVFIAKLTAEKPELVKQYSAQDLQEIAAIYAYSYSDEDVYNPKGNALKQIKALQKKHHLEEDDQFDDSLGNSVDEIVAAHLKTQANTADLDKLIKQYKTAEAVFAQYYMQQFEAENEIEKEQRAEYLKTVNVLAKAYTAFKKHQFDYKVLESLNADSVEFIDYGIFRTTYQAISDAKLK